MGRYHFQPVFYYIHHETTSYRVVTSLIYSVFLTEKTIKLDLMLNGCSIFYTPHFLKMAYALLCSKCISSSQLDKYLEQTSCMPYILPFVHKKHNIAMKFHPLCLSYLYYITLVKLGIIDKICCVA